jgi:hypothetical protein
MELSVANLRQMGPTMDNVGPTPYGVYSSDPPLVTRA